MDLEQVPLVGGQMNGENVNRTSTKMLEMLRSDEGPPVLREKAVAPNLTDEVINRELKVAPVDYWAMNCWTCRAEEHSDFGCPYLTVDQRLHFAYQ